MISPSKYLISLLIIGFILTQSISTAASATKIKTKHRGHVTLSTAAQQLNTESIFAPDFLLGDPSDDYSFVNQRVHANYTANKYGSYSLVFDAQHDRNRFSESDSRINQLYFGFNLGKNLKIKVGKQRVLWGKGFTYIATDFINPPLDPSGLDLAKVGVTAISMDYIRKDYSVTAILTSEEKGVDSGGLKFAFSPLAGLDLDAVLYRAPSVGTAYGGSFSLDAGQVIHENLTNLVIFGSAATHEKSRYPQILSQADQAAIPGELGIEGNYNSGLLGAMYQATGTLSLTGEYYKIGDAYSSNDYSQILQPLADLDNPDREGFFNWLNVFSAYGRTQKEYVSLSVSKAPLTLIGNRFSDNLSLDVGMLRAKDDSYLFTFAATSAYWGRAEVIWRTTWTGGSKATEFATAPFNWYSEISVKIGF